MSADPALSAPRPASRGARSAAPADVVSAASGEAAAAASGDAVAPAAGDAAAAAASGDAVAPVSGDAAAAAIGDGVVVHSVVLVGFMGSGKSHVGRLLAGRLGVPLIDTDALVVAEAGPVETVFAEQGERVFRAIERRVVLDALASLSSRSAVVSLGGGAVTDGDVRAALRAAPCVAWLNAPVDVLWRRVRRAARRGRARPLARDEAVFRALYEQRAPLYREVATVEFHNDGEETASEVAERVACSVCGDA